MEPRAYNPLVAGIFSPPVIRELARTGKSSRIRRAFAATEHLDRNTSLADALDCMYCHLIEHYRSEYVFKNEIANQLLLERHDLGSAGLLTELRVENVKADVVILNGTSTAYEIKTGLDNLDRLPKQLAAFARTFEFVNVVTEPSLVERVMSVAEENIGILTIDATARLTVVRKAKSNLVWLEPFSLLVPLRREERVNIVRKVQGEFPELPNTQFFSYCRGVFEEANVVELHRHFVAALRERALSAGVEQVLEELPRSLTSLFYSAKLHPRDQHKVLNHLKRPAG